MQQVFVGATPRHLASGRPLFFGDVVDASDLTAEDEGLKDFLRPDPPATETEATGPSDNTEDQ